jgi:hypothetical protein
MGKGRAWFGCPGYHQTWNDFHTTVLIEGIGQSGTSTQDHWPSLPGKLVEIIDTANISTFAADAKTAYDWWIQIQDTQIAWYDYQTAANKAPIPTNFSYADHFFDPKLMPTNSSFFYRRVGVHGSYNPVFKAYRSAAMIRGSRPFVVIVDDIQKDNQTHVFKWIANTYLPWPFNLDQYNGGDMYQDLNATTGLSANDYAVFYRKGDTAAKSPRLLLIVLDSSGTADAPIRLETYNITYNDNLNGISTDYARSIAISRSGTVDPKFKVLLYPHLQGDAFPNITWDCNNTVIISWPDSNEAAILKFDLWTDGRTRIRRLNGWNSTEVCQKGNTQNTTYSTGSGTVTGGTSTGTGTGTSSGTGTFGGGKKHDDFVVPVAASVGALGFVGLVGGAVFYHKRRLRNRGVQTTPLETRTAPKPVYTI